MVQGVVAHTSEWPVNLPNANPSESILAPESDVKLEGRILFLCPLYGDVSMNIFDVCLGSSAIVSCHML